MGSSLGNRTTLPPPSRRGGPPRPPPRPPKPPPRRTAAPQPEEAARAPLDTCPSSPPVTVAPPSVEVGPTAPTVVLPPVRPGAVAVRVTRMTDERGRTRLFELWRSARVSVDPRAVLHHPHVLSVQGVGETDDGPVALVDYVGGCSLAELLQAGTLFGRPMPARVALRIVLDACDGLTAIHARRAIHGAVSPVSIHVGDDGITRIVDPRLGTRRPTPARRRPRHPELAYAAPERLGGLPTSAASDVFSIGVVAWEVLALRRLFRADRDPDTTRRVVAEPAPPLSSLRPTLGRDLDNLVGKALAKKPGQRFADVRSFGAALDTVVWRNGWVGSHDDVATYLRLVAGRAQERRALILRSLYATPSDDGGPLAVPREVAREDESVERPPAEPCAGSAVAPSAAPAAQSEAAQAASNELPPVAASIPPAAPAHGRAPPGAAMRPAWAVVALAPLLAVVVGFVVPAMRAAREMPSTPALAPLVAATLASRVARVRAGSSGAIPRPSPSTAALATPVAAPAIRVIAPPAAPAVVPVDSVASSSTPSASPPPADVSRVAPAGGPAEPRAVAPPRAEPKASSRVPRADDGNAAAPRRTSMDDDVPKNPYGS